VTAFVKGHGLGNDYLVLDQRDLAFPLTAAAVVRLCDRHRGVGSDGILLLVDSTTADFGLRIFNPDGTEAEKSGNGVRIFAKYLYDHGRASTPAFRIETRGGPVACECRVDGGRVRAVAVEMGHVTFRDGGRDLRLEVGGSVLTATALSVGNPHCVLFVDELDDGQVHRLGPLLERHAAFPDRTNVQFARVESPEQLAIRIWERGAGYTLASGTSSCAAAAAAVRKGRCAFGRVTVVMPGGGLEVDVRPDWSLRLSGPVEEIATGTLSPDFIAALRE